MTGGLEQLEDLFKDLVWDNLVQAALKELFLLAPALAWGPIGAIITAAATYFADKLYAALKLAADLEMISLREEAHRKAFDDAAVKLRIIADEKGIGSDEFQKAKAAEKDAFRELLRFAQ